MTVDFRKHPLARVAKKVLRIKVIRYGMVSAASTVVDWFVFFIIAVLLGVYHQLSLIIAFSVGGIVSYSINKHFTFFCKNQEIAKQMSVFFVINFAYLIINMIFLYVFVDLLGFEKMLGRIVTSFAAFGIGYLMHSFVTFNRQFFKP